MATPRRLAPGLSVGAATVRGHEVDARPGARYWKWFGDRGLAGAGAVGVDPVEHAGEVARFWSKVVKGPGARDCWIFTGAIADDGYGR